MTAFSRSNILLLSSIMFLTAFWLDVKDITSFRRSPNTFLGLFCLVSVCLVLLVGRHKTSLWHWFFLRRKIDTSDPEICKRILNGTVFDSLLCKNQLSLTEAKARPNQRLVRAFGIDNGFTTLDHRWASTFKRHASEKLRNNSNWAYIAKIAEGLVKRSFETTPDERKIISLNELVQSTTLRMSVHVLFNTDPLIPDDLAIDIGARINYLWLLSKDPKADCAEELQKLHQALSKAQIHTSQDPRDNALNLILPAYETLWRVVLRCFLETTFRSMADPTWSSVLTAFLKEPSGTKFTEVSPGDTGVSTSFLVNEALRLYPPTRRIYRELHLPSEAKPRVVAANIEACHRRNSIWGTDSEQFVPSRWGYATPEMRGAFMPFGGQPFVCPAKAEFGPHMIGLLVAALATHVSPREWALATVKGTGLEEFGLGYEPLDSARNAYGDVVLVRK